MIWAKILAHTISWCSDNIFERNRHFSTGREGIEPMPVTFLAPHIPTRYRAERKMSKLTTMSSSMTHDVYSYKSASDMAAYETTYSCARKCISLGNRDCEDDEPIKFCLCFAGSRKVHSIRVLPSNMVQGGSGIAAGFNHKHQRIDCSTNICV